MSPVNWARCTLGELMEIRHGYAFAGEYFVDDGELVLLTPGSFNLKGGLRLKGAKEKFYAGPVPPGYLLERGDILVAMTDLTQQAPILGSSLVIPESGRFLHNQRLGKVVNLNTDRVRSEFVAHLFNAPFVREQIKGSASGATVRHTSPTRIGEVIIDLPPLSAQRQIAAVLSGYGDLIQTNLRRTQILEEMASAIYREWFVLFRFPGHEGIARAESPIGLIPQGWSTRPLGDVCHLVMGQSPPSESYNDFGEGLPFHQGVKDFGARFPSDRMFCTCEGRLAEAGDVLLSVRAPVGRMNMANKRMVMGRGLCAIRHHEGHQAFLWELLRDRFQEEDSIGNGSIFAAVTKAELAGLHMLCPPVSVLEAASAQLVPLHRLTELLSVQVANLRATRDLLLPRLMSGQLTLREVEEAVPASL